jgi:DNA-directed RNA polymerase specialized sigma24 family protein
MLKNSQISQEDFESLLDWLDPNREAAAKKYEAIRLSLIKIFLVRKHFDAEYLADLVFDRVCRKLPEIVSNYHGRKDLYFYGVAKKVHLEAQHQIQNEELEINRLSSKSIDEEESDIYIQCLEMCLEKLSVDERNLVIGYYQNERAGKIDDRKKIALRLGISIDNLRIKLFRLRSEIKKCVLSCVERS